MLWCMLGVFAWAMRDGLGPDSVESHGWGAVSRLFWTFYWGPVLVALALVFALWVKYMHEPSNQAEAEL